MFLTLCKSKIHRATVTEANLAYLGSITIAVDLMEAAGLLAHERVQVLNLENGTRLETYVIPGERGSGVICLNGAAAHHFKPGDLAIIIAYAHDDIRRSGRNGSRRSSLSMKRTPFRVSAGRNSPSPRSNS